MEIKKLILAALTSELPYPELKSDLSEIAKALRAIATDTEKTANIFERNHARIFSNGNAYRFNVTTGLQNIGLHEVKRWNEIEASSHLYIEQHESLSKLKKCSFKLRHRECIAL